MTKITKIIIPILMICSIIGIGILKNDTHEYIQTNVEYPLTVTSIDLEELTESNLPIIIDFGADSCILCKEMAPVLITLNEEFQGRAIVQFVDVWKSPEAANQFPIQVIPTQVFINADGSPYYPSEELANLIQFSMYSDRETEEHVFTTHQGGLTEEQMRLILSDIGVG